ncbi:hypothetical protein H6G33_08520 [Calothrix sp. FACHB-1219]|nr:MULTISPECIES: hypothetical protein [unclassified Calothrix]MBD2202037.1 hypothetical protein [Calothrix sp. FACHB-168]MBD2217073.1 hypothetical protein [Calothrix sp. FACHB-1219]
MFVNKNVSNPHLFIFAMKVTDDSKPANPDKLAVRRELILEQRSQK